MRDRPHPNHKLEWPGGIVPEWARPPQNPNKRRGKGAGAAANSKRERLQKVMAQSGHGSRRNIEILIAQGHLTINGQVAKLGDLVGPGDKVKLDGELIRLRFGEPLPRVLLYHKPEGEIVTRDDPDGRATVFEKLPKVTGGRWVSVGRLDLNTGGLLIFSTSGELANRLTHPRFEVEREYAVRVMGELTEEQQAKLLEGVEIDSESCKFDSIEDRGGEGSNHWYHVVLREGKNREVRKMCEAVGLMVSRLMRVRFGPVALPTFLKRGMMRELEEDETQDLLGFAGMNEPVPAPAPDSAAADEHENIGNRLDYHANREPRAKAEADGNREDIGNRISAPARPVEEPDGNRGTYQMDAPAPGSRAGQPGARRPQGQKPFGFKKRGPGQAGHRQPGHGPQGQPAQHVTGQPGQGKPHNAHRKFGKGKGPGAPGAPHGGRGNAQAAPQGQPPAQPGNAGAPSPQQGQAPAAGQGKPAGRHRRNKNRNRPRGGPGARGDQQPGTNGNREP